MDSKKFEKKLELREWQKMFNPSKPNNDDSVILKKSQGQSQEKSTTNSSFSWG